MNKLLSLPILASEHGADVDKLIIYVHLLMGVLFVGWLVFFLYALWRFRTKNHPKADYVGAKTHASSYAEVAVAVVEGVLLIGFAVPLWAKSVQAFPAEKDSTVVRVTGRQFNWITRYPGKDGVFFEMLKGGTHNETELAKFLAPGKAVGQSSKPAIV